MDATGHKADTEHLHVDTRSTGAGAGGLCEIVEHRHEGSGACNIYVGLMWVGPEAGQ